MKRIEVEIKIDVAFYDLDPMQIVWHGNYVKYFELARCALLDRIGYNYKAMKESGFAWPLIDLRLRYVKSAVQGQKLKCLAWIVEYENRLKIGYEIRCAKTNAKMTKGDSVQVAVDTKTQEMQLVSPRILHERMNTMYEE